ncbi:hypothetical protein MNEG_1420 [Monoraphidium neglectum]|uniref:BZIP domain-containing protein n=1 Tax=Monoraphidium neglectum TaxID=145388 RepID=A0A0D2N219_9CHLO|nr:hypothetical protein MNEG_1420 [Monoraphidium neglectum]KIZ06532.1 hypothetical protein MNEG_1420 [Monoraphidium neglectum]|eukprot:XP_013905551.1 hypothetical protein MNEG_1420 [Monoraphidium neglectum]
MQRQNAPVAAMGRHAAPHHAPLAAAAPAAAAGAGGAACASPPSAQQPGSSSGDSARGRRPRGRKRARGGDGAASPERPARTDCHLDPIDSEAKLKRQQDLNKAAQQRYRQRRKERQSTIEASLEGMRERNAALQAQVATLHSALLGGPLAWPAALAPAQLLPAVPAVPLLPLAAPAPGAALVAQQVGANLLAPIQLSCEQPLPPPQQPQQQQPQQQPSPLLALDSAVRAAAAGCAAAVDVSCGGGCLQAAAGAGVGAAASCGAGACGAAPAPGSIGEKQRWLEILAEISLSDDQIQDLLRLRHDLVSSLAACLDARHALAAELLLGPDATAAAAAAAAPPRPACGYGPREAPGGGAAAAAARLQALGYVGAVARESLAARGVLERLQESIAHEGQLVSSFTLAVLTGTLAAEQAAVVMARHPNAADVIGLTNALSEICDMVPRLGAICGAAAPAAAVVTAAAAAAAAAMRRAAAAAASHAGGGGAAPAGAATAKPGALLLGGVSGGAPALQPPLQNPLWVQLPDGLAHHFILPSGFAGCDTGSSSPAAAPPLEAAPGSLLSGDDDSLFVALGLLLPEVEGGL